MRLQSEMKPISEANYMTTSNAWRYRAILRFFYTQHDKLRHYLLPEEVYEHLRDWPQFRDYTEDQLQQDLNQLVEWNNLIPRQETGKVNTIEDFKRKKFRYQCTPYTIEFERLLHNLEHIGESFGGSLERTLFERLFESLLQVTSFQGQGQYSNEEIHTAWEEMMDQFRKVTEGATDYLAYLKSEKVEEAMMTESFLVFKEDLTQYLRDFMTTLQRTSFRIEKVLEETSATFIKDLTRRLADYQLSIPRLEEQPSAEELQERFREQWSGLEEWFLGRNGRESDLAFLQNETNETIRRITRYAQRLGERHHNFRSRKKDYLHLANWFHDMDEINEAHELSATVFGLLHTRHLYAGEKETEDIEAEVWDEPPTMLSVKPRIRGYREKTRPGAVVSRRKEKEEMLKAYLQEKEAEQRLIEQMITGDKMIISDLPVVDPYVRKTLLSWIGKCMSTADHTAKTESGRQIRLLKIDDRPITLQSRDGELRMPNYAFKFLD